MFTFTYSSNYGYSVEGDLNEFLMKAPTEMVNYVLGQWATDRFGWGSLSLDDLLEIGNKRKEVSKMIKEFVEG